VGYLHALIAPCSLIAKKSCHQAIVAVAACAGDVFEPF
jgi:hypothetical protein